MSLFEDLKALGNDIPESHLPTVTDIRNFVGALAFYVEHGADVVEQVKGNPQGVANVLGGYPVDHDPSQDVPTVIGGEDQGQRIAELETQLSTLLASLGRTQVGEPQQ